MHSEGNGLLWIQEQCCGIATPLCFCLWDCSTDYPEGPDLTFFPLQPPFQGEKPNCSSWAQEIHLLSDGGEITDLFTTAHRPVITNINKGQIFIKSVRQLAAKLLFSELLMLVSYEEKTLVLTLTLLLKSFFPADDRRGKTTKELKLFVLPIASGLLDKLENKTIKKNCYRKEHKEVIQLKNTTSEVATFFFFSAWSC